MNSLWWDRWEAAQAGRDYDGEQTAWTLRAAAASSAALLVVLVGLILTDTIRFGSFLNVHPAAIAALILATLLSLASLLHLSDKRPRGA